ncbi:hypothetical protein HDV05_001587 [Chytridiales sp. JEL 0842]|nr:hypothetical protein HDV05_001587 [Chytridiales sp. JEL 0842]
MNPPRLLVSLIALLLTCLVYHVHKKSSNIALRLLLGTGIIVEVALFGCGVLLNAHSRFSGTEVGSVGFGRVAFLIAWGSIAVYGACTCLAIELLIRTRSPSMLHRRDSITRGYYYTIPTLLIPLVLAILTVRFRMGDAPIFTPLATCGNNTNPVVFFAVYVVALWLYSIVGTVFTIWAIAVYTKRRKTILRSLAASMPNASYTNSTVNVFSNRNHYRQDLAETASISSTPSDDEGSSESELEEESVDVVEPTSRKELNRMSSTRKKAAVTPQRSTKLARRRMIFWSVGYHALISVNLVVTTVSCIPALRSYLMGEDDDNLEKTRTLRAVTIIWAAGGLSLLQFVCFGIGRDAWETYKKMFPVLKRFERLDVRKMFQRRPRKTLVAEYFADTPQNTAQPTPAPTDAMSKLTAQGWKISIGGANRSGSRTSIGSLNRQVVESPSSRSSTPPCNHLTPSTGCEEQRFVSATAMESSPSSLEPTTSKRNSLASGSESTSTLLAANSSSHDDEILPAAESVLPGLPVTEFCFSGSDDEDRVGVEK